MPLMTREYNELQRRLHAQGNYGLSSGYPQCAGIVAAMAAPGASVLDYGSGANSRLKDFMPGFDVREYDPCVEGKDGPPEPADYVVCADVLEHIEPECLDDVIGHLRSLTRNRLIAIVNMGPANKTLEDGRNAHLIQEGTEFWKEKLHNAFRIERIEEQAHEGRQLGKDKDLLLVLEPIALMTQLKAVGVLSDEERNAHTAANIGRTWNRLPQAPIDWRTGRVSMDAPAFIRRHELRPDTVAIVCCYGPSIKESIKVLPEQIEANPHHKVISVSGTHDFLLKHDITPDWHVECDPRLHKSKMVKRISDKTHYFMASCCHPKYVERIDPDNLVLWHLFNGEESYKIRNMPSEKDQALMPGGGSVGLRTFVMLYFLGFRRFIVHGFDCSYGPQGETHAGKHAGKKLKTTRVRIEGDDEWFETAPVMITYAQHMVRDIQQGRYPGCVFHFMGDGLFQKMVRKEYIEKEKTAPPEGFGTDYFSMRQECARPEETWSSGPKQETAA